MLSQFRLNRRDALFGDLFVSSPAYSAFGNCCRVVFFVNLTQRNENASKNEKKIIIRPFSSTTLVYTTRKYSLTIYECYLMDFNMLYPASPAVDVKTCSKAIFVMCMGGTENEVSLDKPDEDLSTFVYLMNPRGSGETEVHDDARPLALCPGMHPCAPNALCLVQHRPIRRPCSAPDPPPPRLRMSPWGMKN